MSETNQPQLTVLSAIDGLIRKYWHIAVVIAAVAVFMWAVYALRAIVFPFLIGLAAAYVLHPTVDWLEKRMPRRVRWLPHGRVSAIAVVYIVAIIMFGIFLFFTVSAVIRALGALASSSGDYFAGAADVLKQWTQPLRGVVPESLRSQMDSFIEGAGQTAMTAINDNVSHMVSALPSNLGTVLGIAAVPYFLFYVLKDHEKLTDGLYSGLPAWASGHTRKVLGILENSFGRYIRSSLTLGLIVGVLNLVGLLVIRAPLAPLLAVVAGVCEMIPMVGAWVGGIIAVIVTLALAPDKVIWVAAIFLVVQLVENLFLVPKVQSAYFKIHPAFTIVLLAVGTYFAGFWGVILALPLTATIVGVYKYCCEVKVEPEPPDKDVLPSPSE